MINWKEAARHYRSIALEAIHRVLQDEAVRVKEERVMAAARAYVELVTTPRNPFVNLVTGQDINVQKSQQTLVKAVSDLDEFIQSYSQTPEDFSLPQKLDN